MKKAIIIASFGCSIKEVREKYIESIEEAVKKQYNDIDCFRVFTSEIIRKKIKIEENIHIDNINTCLEKLKVNGYTKIYVVVTHIIPGVEYEKIIRACSDYEINFEEIKVSRPFLDDEMDNMEVDVIKSYIKTSIENIQKDEAVILIAHGTCHEAHKYYEQLKNVLIKDMPNIYMANIEGNPFAWDLVDELKEKNIRKINLYPFFIVAGDHALNDIASDDEDSIKSHFIRNSFEVNVFITGLGANEKAIKLFVDRLNEII